MLDKGMLQKTAGNKFFYYLSITLSYSDVAMDGK